MECVQLAGAFEAPPLSESASKLDALHTLRAEECLHRAIIRDGTYDLIHHDNPVKPLGIAAQAISDCQAFAGGRATGG